MMFEEMKNKSDNAREFARFMIEAVLMDPSVPEDKKLSFRIAQQQAAVLDALLNLLDIPLQQGTSHKTKEQILEYLELVEAGILQFTENIKGD